MSPRALKSSLSLWRRRERWAQKRLDVARGRNDKSRVAKWEARHKVCLGMVKRRKAQLDRPTLQQAALQEARKLVGVMEHGGNNQGGKVTEIIRANGGTGPEPWCGDFVAYCYRRAGSKSVQRGWAAVAYIGRLAGMRIVKTPTPGDLVCFSFDHVGMYVRDLGNGNIETIEGNTGASGARSDSSTGGDGVYVKSRSKGLVARYVRVAR